MSNLPFDDWIENDNPQAGGQPAQIDSASWFEVEAGGPGAINRMASITGILVTGISSSRNIGDGTIMLDTGYRLNPKLDTWESLIKGQKGVLASCFVELSSIEAQDDGLADEKPRNGWLESVSADMQSTDDQQLALVLTIKANLDGDVALQRIGYQVILLFNSNRPPTMMKAGGFPGGSPPFKRHPDKSAPPQNRAKSGAMTAQRRNRAEKPASSAVRGKVERTPRRKR